MDNMTRVVLAYERPMEDVAGVIPEKNEPHDLVWDPEVISDNGLKGCFVKRKE